MRAGHSRVLVVRGEAGIGKSALLQYLVGAAAGFSVVRATGVESEMELPFAALHQLCAPLLDRLAALPDPQRDAASTAFGLINGGTPERLLIGLAVLSLLSSASDDKPLLCVVDDAQWLDRESAQALTFVARRLLADRVALVFATRQPSADFAAFPELVVAPLHDLDAQALLGAVLHAPIDERVRDRIVAETRGNPLALMEWPRGLSREELAGGFGMPTALSMTGQIEESFRRRIAELPAPTQRFMTVASAEPTGDPTIVWRAAGGLGIEAQEAAPAIDAGLVEIGVRVWFRHPLVRSAAYGSAALGDRQAAHRALAEAVDQDLDPDRRAWHRALGSANPDEEIAEALDLAAGRARARGGLAAAAALLERSVLMTVDPNRRGERILAAAVAHLDAGSFDRAAGLMASADVTLLDEIQRAELHDTRARLAIFSGDARSAPELLVRAAKRMEPLDLDLAEILHLRALSSACLVGSLSGGLRLADIAQAAAACPRSNTGTANEWLVVGFSQLTLDGPLTAAPVLRRVLNMTGNDTRGVERFTLLGYLCGAATVLWDADAFRGIAVEQVELTRELGALSMLPGALNVLAQVHVLEGELDAAASAIAEAREVFEATGNKLQASVAALLAGLRGDADVAELIANQTLAARRAGLGLALKSAQWATATLHNGRGEYEQALAAALDAVEHPWEWNTQLFVHELIEAAVRSGRHEEIGPTLARLEESVEASGSDWALGMLARCRALLAQGAHAEALYDEAIDRLRRTRIRPELARAHLLYGEWLRREKRRVDAREQLRVAYEMFDEMGIHGFAERTRHELLATGETVRKRTVESFDELTPQEAHIARLASEGRTNPEIGAQLFISARTVEWHLRKVFTKLSITSRRELRDVLPGQASQAHA